MNDTVAATAAAPRRLLGPFLAPVIRSSVKAWLHLEGALAERPAIAPSDTSSAEPRGVQGIAFARERQLTDCVGLNGLALDTQYCRRFRPSPALPRDTAGAPAPSSSSTCRNGGKAVPHRISLGLAAFLLATPAWAHPGGLAADGCHNDRKNGGRHCHRAAPGRAPASAPQRTLGGAVYFANCSAARAAGAAPVRRGDPGYARHLDRDGNGVGCEQ